MTSFIHWSRYILLSRLCKDVSQLCFISSELHSPAAKVAQFYIVVTLLEFPGTELMVIKENINFLQ